jgi:pseudaminic acid synthase
MKIGNLNLKDHVLIIAELSANHGQSLEIAMKTVAAAKSAGADAIKLQTYTADTLTINCDNECFQLSQGTIWDGRTLYDLYLEAHTPWEWHKELKDYAESIGLIFLSTPFDKSAADFLDELGVPAFKIASFEIMDIPLIEHVASKGKPIMISTGIATLGDIEEAIFACRRQGNNQIILLKCTSSYPAKVEDANLKTIPNMETTFGVPVGLSDHTLGSAVPIVSVAMGARIIEKHFILDKSLGGPDSSFSLDTAEFEQMVKDVRIAERALGVVDYSMPDQKLKNRQLGRSLFVVKDIKAGEVFTEENVRSIRPGYGLPPKYLQDIIGRIAKNEIKRGTPLKWNLL